MRDLVPKHHPPSAAIPVADTGFLLLGAPIGSQDFINHHVEDKVAACSRTWQALSAIGDHQTELLLLRSCLSFGKVSYLIHTTPLYNFNWTPYESGIRSSVDQILGSSLPDQAWLHCLMEVSDSPWTHSQTSLRWLLALYFTPAGRTFSERGQCSTTALFTHPVTKGGPAHPTFH